MVNRHYHCHDCDHDFERPEDETPECPKCGGGSVTFEGEVTPTLPERFWYAIRPIVNFFFRPWRFFNGRGIARSTGIFLMMVLYVGMFVAGYQAQLTDPGKHSLGSPGSYYILRDPGVLIGDLTQVSSPSPRKHRSSKKDSGVTLGQVGFVYGFGLFLEIFWAVTILVGVGWDQFQRARAQLGAVMAGTVWIPNLILAMVQIVYFRCVQYGYLEPLRDVPSLLRGSHLLISGWMLFILLGGLASLELRFSQWLFRVILTGLVQVFGIFVILNVTKVFLFPRMNLPGGGTGVSNLKEALKLTLWPLVGVFL